MKIKYFLSITALVASSAIAQIPSGYYNAASGKTGAELKTALHTIIRGHTRKTYDYLWTAFYTSDDKPNGTVWDIYSDIPDGSANGNPPYVYNFGTNQCSATPGYENGCYNREHSFPKSWFDGVESDTMYSDMFQLYPTDSYVNGRRNNYPYGAVTSPTWTSQNGSKLGPCTTAGYTGTVFEPRDEYKGDLARTYFYMATRYESRIASWEPLDVYGNAVLDGTSYPCFETWFLNMLIAWHEADPVSQKEIDRNNTIHSSFQGNRNPYIDHPEYVASVWDPGAGVLPEPTNHPANFSAHNIHIQWTDATGTTVPDAYLIRMSSTGYSSIEPPADWVSVPDDADDKNVPYGVEEVWFNGLNANTTYYFKIYGYVVTEAGNDYKTDGVVPQVQKTTQP